MQYETLGGLAVSTSFSARRADRSAKTAAPDTRKELGDFQTPLDLALGALRAVRSEQSRSTRVLEPTCGTGTFLRAAAEQISSPLELFGIEIQPQHADKARRALRRYAPAGVKWQVQTGNIFTHNLGALPWRTSGPLLVVGNPPWITLAELGAMDSKHVPERSNLRSVRGIDALTGDSNFDVAEYIWMRLLTELREQRPTVALLCKTSVARRVLTQAHRLRLDVAEASLWRIDAKRTFGVSADACLFMIRLGEGSPDYTCAVYESLTAPRTTATMGVVNGALVADVDAHQASRSFDGRSPVEWRQGVKHDASRALELLPDGNGGWRNGLGESVTVEASWSFPLMKGSDIYSGRQPGRRVIVTQRSLGEDPRALRRVAPKLWTYLEDHEDRFSARKSSIYRGRPRFSIFGVGPYTFSPWKVAVSSFWKVPKFRVIGPVGGQPVLFDDTSYFLPCDTCEQAAIIAATLRSEPAAHLLKSLLFVDAKRVVTKKLLQRIDLYAILSVAREAILTDAATIRSELRRKEPPADLDAKADSLLRQWRPREPALPLFDRNGDESRGRAARPLA